MHALGHALNRELAIPRVWLLTLGVPIFAALTALGAFVRIPLPGTPVPMTLQTLVVLAAGLVLGRRAGVLSQLLYVTAGSLGLPIFAGAAYGLAAVTGPTGGYLMGFIAAPFVVAELTRRGHALVGLFAAEVIIFSLGVLHLATTFGMGLPLALSAGLVPFLPGEALKLIAAWRGTRWLGSN